MFLAKDFIETAEGLVFAVVESGCEQDKVLCFLRYIKLNSGWQKVNTQQANQLLLFQYPQYLYYSTVKQAHLHAVSFNQVAKHYQPRIKLRNILASQTHHAVENDLIKLCYLFAENGLNIDDIGVTGSILIGAQQQNSDIDLVFYGRQVFHQARKITQQLIKQEVCFDLNENDWQNSFDRRLCDLSFKEYVWHEKRKFNKAVINQRKFDLSYISTTEINVDTQNYFKLNPVVLKFEIIDDTSAFDYPAQFFIKHKEITSIICYTATYTGQAKKGEWVEVAGLLEESEDGIKRIVVGSSREAQGEYIKVINA